MTKVLCKILFLLALIHINCIGQDIDPAPGYQMVLMNNPALYGCEGDGSLRLSYINFYPGNNFNLHSVHLSYDSFFPGLHGGTGFYLADDYLGGIVNDLRGGLSYAYFLQVDKDLFINAGLSASFYHRGYSFNGAVLPDQIDPFSGVSVPSSEILTASGRTVFDIGTGLIFTSGKVSGGFSVNHLAEPDLSETGFSGEKLKRKLFLHISGDLNIKKAESLKMRPVLFMSLQGKFISAGAGSVIESNNLSANVMLFGDSGKNMNIQTGFSLNMRNISVFYNYRFNIVSMNVLLPVSLLHQAGLAFILNKVEKRNIIKTINFPKL